MELFPAAVFNPSRTPRARPPRDAAAGRSVECLPFTIRRVATESDLTRAGRMRRADTARHAPAFARILAQSDAASHDDVILLLAESKLDGAPLGAVRLGLNQHRALGIEQSVVLPRHLQGRRLAEAVWLDSEQVPAGKLVQAALIKACFMACEDRRVDYALVAGRPSVARQAGRLTFVDLFPHDGPIRLRHAGAAPHRVMACRIDSLQQRWTDLRHPLQHFFFHTHHPDIDTGLPKAAPSPALATPHPVMTALLPVRREMAFA